MSATISALDAFLTIALALTALGIVISRQMQALLRLFVWQSILLAGSAVVLAIGLHSQHLYFVAAIALISKAIAIPLVLRGAASGRMYARREIDQVLPIPTALLIAAALAIIGWAFVRPLAAELGSASLTLHLSVGVVVMLLGAFTVVVRREAVAQLLGLLVLENGAFLVGIALVPDLNAIVEVAAAVDVPLVALVIGLLIRTIEKEVGTTSVGQFDNLKEG